MRTPLPHHSEAAAAGAAVGVAVGVDAEMLMAVAVRVAGVLLGPKGPVEGAGPNAHVRGGHGQGAGRDG